MKVVSLLLVVILHCCKFHIGAGKNHFTGPSIVNIGAVLAFNSTIGRTAKIAIETAVNDINSNSSILRGTKLVVKMQDSSCNSFIGIVQALQLMEMDVVAVVGPQSSVIAHVLLHAANELQVPLLSFAATDPTLSSMQHPFFVRTAHSDLFQMTAIAELVEYYNWNKVIAVYIDDDYGRNGVSVLGDILEERRHKVSYKAALPPECTRDDITNLLLKVALMESRVIVVHVNQESGLTVFSVAHYLGMLTNGYVWIATDWLSSLLDTSAPLATDSMNLMQGVLALRQHVPDSGRKNAFISRWREQAMKKNEGNVGITSYALYAYDTMWTIAQAVDAFLNEGGTISFSNDSRLQNLQGHGTLRLKAMRVFDDGKLMLKHIVETDMIGVTGPIRFNSNRHLIRPAYDILNIIGTGYRKIGYWSNISGLSVVPPDILYSKKSNISRKKNQLHSVIWPGETNIKPRGWAFPRNGKELRIGVPYRTSYKEFVSEVKRTGTLKGYCIDVFTAAVSLLPYALPYRFFLFGDGKRNPDYSMLVEMVASGEFDVAVGDVTIVTNRTKIVDFTQPYIESGLVILAAVQRHGSSTWAFLQPFTLKMWCVTGGFFVVIGAVVWILEHRLNDEFRGPPKKQVVTICWFGFSTLFFSHRENTVSTLGRFVVLIWLFVVLIIQSSYTANLTSILTVQQLSSSIKGIDSLLAGDEPIGFQVGSFAENYMVEELGISKSRLRSLNNPEDYARALDLGPRNGGVAAVVDERPYIDHFLSTKCKYAVIGSEFTKSGWGFAFPRDSPLALDMSTAILTLSENGDLQRIHDKWLTTSGCSSGSTELDSDRLHLSSFYGLFLICGVACFLALLIYLLLTLRQFRHHFPNDMDDASDQGSTRSTRSIHKFLSFADGKEEEARQRRRQKQLEKENSQHSNTSELPAAVT